MYRPFGEVSFESTEVVADDWRTADSFTGPATEDWEGGGNSFCIGAFGVTSRSTTDSLVLSITNSPSPGGTLVRVAQPLTQTSKPVMASVRAVGRRGWQVESIIPSASIQKVNGTVALSVVLEVKFAFTLGLSGRQVSRPTRWTRQYSGCQHSSFPAFWLH